MNTKVVGRLLAFVAVAALSAATASAREYLLVSKGNTLPKGLAGKVQAAGGSIARAIPQVGIVVVRSEDAAFKARAAVIPGIGAIVPNLVIDWLPDEKVVAADFGNPPASGDDDFFFDLQWGHDAVDAPEAWNEGHRGAGAVVAVLDTGFDLDHPDLAPNIVDAVSFVPGEGVGYAQPDPFSHGSHVAGTIAAADNAFGTIGVAPLAKLMLVKVLRDTGSGAFDWVISGIVYAADHGADVINMSLGGYLFKSGDCSDPDDCYTAREAAELKNAVARATTYAYQKGTMVIAAAGNESVDFDHTANLVFLPGAAPHVLAISASAPVGWALGGNPFLDYPSSYTNFGQSAIDFAAPGGDFVYPGDELCTVVLTRPCWVFDLVFSTGSSLDPAVAQYFWSAGTSMAAPHASGVAAIIVGKHGGSLKPAQLEAELRKAADDLGKPGNDDYYGAGRVNAANAVQ
jgi:subtilisin family serine protease